MQKNRQDQRARRRRRKRRERMNYMIMSFLVLFVIFGSVYCRSIEMENEKAAQAASIKKEQVAKEPDTVSESESTKLAEDNTEDEKQNAEQEEVVEEDTRTDFAVNPEVACGSYTQSDEKIVYLTFDDGPSQMTQSVLDILDKYNAKATFFVTNTSPDYAYMIKQVYDKGHTIGLHTGCHDYNNIYSSKEAYFADLDAIGETVKAQIGYVPCFIRFPGGTSNTIVTSLSPGLMMELITDVRQKGYQYYDWNWSSGDGGVHTAPELIDQATQCLDNNIILLCHDSATKQSTVDALPKIIEHYSKLGYKFKAIDRESYVAHHLSEENM